MSNTRDQLRAYLDRKGWTITRLAQESGIGEKTIRNFLNGKGNPTYDVLLKIKQTLNLPLAIE